MARAATAARLRDLMPSAAARSRFERDGQLFRRAAVDLDAGHAGHRPKPRHDAVLDQLPEVEDRRRGVPGSFCTKK